MDIVRYLSGFDKIKLPLTGSYPTQLAPHTPTVCNNDL
jgi:hypothetical protein